MSKRWRKDKSSVSTISPWLGKLLRIVATKIEKSVTKRFFTQFFRILSMSRNFVCQEESCSVDSVYFFFEKYLLPVPLFESLRDETVRTKVSTIASTVILTNTVYYSVHAVQLRRLFILHRQDGKRKSNNRPTNLSSERRGINEHRKSVTGLSI